MRRAARTDQTQEEIVLCLRLMGASVQSMAAIGKGCPDLLIGYKGAWYVAECKTGAKAGFTPDQLQWALEAKGSPPLRFNSAGDATAWAASIAASTAIPGLTPQESYLLDKV